MSSCRKAYSLDLQGLMDRRQIERISKALADQTRLHIYAAIAKGNGMTCGDIVALHGVTPATISHHLKILADAGLIACHREGQFVHNQALRETITAYTAALTRLAAGKKKARRRE
jgi:ArsR family transcriptional regulator